MLSELGTLKEMIRFEWRHHSRQPAFFAAAALFSLLGVLTATNFGADNVTVNSPYLVMEAFGFLSLFSLFAAAIFASNAVLRDDEHRMREIVDSTPVGRFPFLFGRFAGSFLATLTAVSFSAAGSILATLTPLAPADRVAAFDLRAYLAAFTVITIPNVLFATALLFTVALLTRNAMATYAAAIVVYILYFVCSALTNSPLMAASKAGGGGGTFPALADPFGLTAFFDVTRYWTAAAKSVRFVPLTGTLLANRAIWLAAAVVLWLVMDRTFSFRSSAVRKGAQPSSLPVRRLPAGRAPAAGRMPADRRAGRLRLTVAGMYGARLRMELRALVTKTALLLLVVWLGLAASQIYADVLDGEYRSTLYPHTSLIMASLQQPLWLVGMILILYFGAEMFWREQRFRMAPILDSTPVSGAAMIAAKWTALAAVVAALVLGGIATGVAIQISRGFVDFRPLLYLSLFYFAGLPLVLYAAASLFIHALSPGKYAGMVFFLLFVIFTRRAPMLGLEHPLWRFAGAPPVAYSEMNGFGDSAAPFHQFMLHWSAVALLFVTIAVALWRRIGAPMRERFRILRHPSGLALALLVAIAGTGTWIFATTDRETPSDLLDWKADYEKAYKHIESMPGPTIRGIDANVDLHPGERMFHVAARYTLVNETGHPIESVFVAMRREARVALLMIPGAHLAARDSRFGMSRFNFQRPLMPGSRAELRADFTSGTDDDSIAGNGSLVMSDRTFPSLGYRRTYELLDPRERRERGLPEAQAGESRDLGLDDSLDDSADQFMDFRATVSTSADQIAVAPGRLEQTWTGNGRRWFRYRAEAPIVNRFGIASARYAVATREHRGVTIEVDYDPKHAMNVAHILDSAAAALDAMQTSIARYPHKQLRIVEVPNSWPFAGFALPQMILLREDRAFLTDMRDPERPDLIARRVAHEVAHQWFGYRIVAKSAAGGLAITESLAKYGELLVVERMHGREHVRQLLEIELDRYLTGRAREEDREVPLSAVERQPYLYYNKGAVVLWAIRDLLGPEAMDGAIRGLLSDRHPTGTDLARHLRLAADAENAALIDQWMNDIVLYDLGVESARAQRRPDGRFDVTLRINAAKVRADGRGNETPLTMEEPIEIAIEGVKSVLHSQKYVLRTGMNEITVVAGKMPESATVDPWVTRIDRNPLDNAKAVEHEHYPKDI